MPFTPIAAQTCDSRLAQPSAAEIEADFWRTLSEIEAESIGWTALAPGCYFHEGTANPQTVNIVGIASADMADDHVVWLY